MLAGVQAFAYRVADLSELREDDGKRMSTGRVRRVNDVADELEQHSKRLRELLEEAEVAGKAPEGSLEFLSLYRDFREVDEKYGDLLQYSKG